MTGDMPANATPTPPPPPVDPWLSRQRAQVVLLSLATATAFYLCFQLISPFLSALAWALVLAIVAHPLHQWIARGVHNLNVSALLAVLIVALVIVAPLLLIAHRVVRDAVDAVTVLNEKTAADRWQQLLAQNPRFEENW